ncbi:hypothetical protein MPSEU_000733600 [Mayamaea pseudoterrestris]|nr:hypothetical protein MPSEU_000733600 [Mayamaea pseudoterrestris]
MDQLDCAALNNEGVFYFQQGELAASLAKFRSALELTIGSLEPTVTPATESSQSCGRDAPSRSVNQHRPREGNSSIDFVSILPVEDVMSGLQTYNRPINLVATPAAYSSDPLVNATVVSSIILFNLALVYHLKGLEGSDDTSRSRLLSAQSLYTKSRALLEEAGFSSYQSCGHPVVDILIMAILNNQGQLTFSLLDYEQSQKFFDCLVVFCSTVRPQDHQQDDGALLEWHMSAFLVNAITLQQPTHASAA